MGPHGHDSSKELRFSDGDTSPAADRSVQPELADAETGLGMLALGEEREDDMPDAYTMVFGGENTGPDAL